MWRHNWATALDFIVKRVWIERVTRTALTSPNPLKTKSFVFIKRCDVWRHCHREVCMTRHYNIHACNQAAPLNDKRHCLHQRLRDWVRTLWVSARTRGLTYTNAQVFRWVGDAHLCFSRFTRTSCSRDQSVWRSAWLCYVFNGILFFCGISFHYAKIQHIHLIRSVYLLPNVHIVLGS